MADIQAAGSMIDLVVKGVTLLLLIIAGSLAIKKKKNLILGVAIIGNLIVYYFTQSPLLCWIVSIACMIWAGLTKSPEQKTEELGGSKSQTTGKKNVKVGNIIGLILGIGLVAGPLFGYLRQEASLSDPTTQGILILFAVIGGFMIVNNLFKLFEKDGAVAPSAEAATAQQPSKAKTESIKKESKNKIRCRFCKKLYGSEYNGCPYCKKK